LPFIEKEFDLTPDTVETFTGEGGEETDPRLI